MSLVATGLFVRAARNARLGLGTNRVVALAIPCTRRASTQSVEKEQEWQQDHVEAFSDQSVSSRREVDPQETTAPTGSASGTLYTKPSMIKLRNEIMNRKQPNKIIHGHGKSGVLIGSQVHVFDETSNLSPSITALIGRRLYTQPNHPICITRKLIESVFARPTFDNHVSEQPVVTTYDNFDVLGFPHDHPGRSRTDTYYVDSKHVLRTHTSAHQHWAFQRMGERKKRGYTICADVFRRDSIDRSHFPVFHQMEGARMWKCESSPHTTLTKHEMHLKRHHLIEKDLKELPSHDLEIVGSSGTEAFNNTTNPKQKEHHEEDIVLVVAHLKKSLEQLVYKVFMAAREAGLGGEAVEQAEKLQVRWVEAYFPFTSPSFELEVFWQGEWLELLGCGVVQETILANAGLKDHIGWAWGIGVERLAMLLFGIPDIRLFWSHDSRFLDQFEAGKIKKYEPFSKYPACYKDVAFWTNAAAASPVGAETSSGVAAAAGGDATKASPAQTEPAAFHENDVMEIVRDVAGSLAEDVSLVDEFVKPSTGRKSLCYRINYRSLEKTLTNEEVNKMHAEVVARLTSELPIELR